MSYTPMQVISTQPGVAPPPGMPNWIQAPQSMPGVPMGLEYLTLLDCVIVHQKKELMEIVSDFEMNNRYVLKNAAGQQAYFALEESGCCERQFCGPRRGFTIHIVDNFQKEVLTVRRDFKCLSSTYCAMCMCCKTECTITSPSTGVVGSARQSFGCCSVNLDILDANGDAIFKIEGPCCLTLISCSDKEFPIKTMDGVIVGAITQKWGGCCKEAFTDADTFQVTFPLDLDVKMKAVLLGATFLIDFLQFEEPKHNNNN
ncbi:unnamed protein product [Caenorhabditis bovis]|uniref:Phospholipid scramblase n=1 Tax=Caenorhabditis bovis TaxID=2654633 RepID=A0A8S1F124_9PELO|nr:unnamed protein product [Caenorhabditis bovis]